MLEVIFSGLITTVIFLIKRVNKVYHSMIQNDEDAKRVDKIVLRNFIWEFSTRCIDRGYVYPDERSIIEETYEEYKKLNGNGVAERRYRIMQGLPDSIERKQTKCEKRDKKETKSE